MREGKERKRKKIRRRDKNENRKKIMRRGREEGGREGGLGYAIYFVFL